MTCTVWYGKELLPYKFNELDHIMKTLDYKAALYFKI